MVMADTLQFDQNKILREKLAQWESKTMSNAPLSSTQRESIMEITTLSGNRPLPIELPLDDYPTITPQSSTHLTADEDSFLKTLSSLQMDEPKVENAQQFFAWFTEIEESMESEEDIEYRAFMEQLTDYQHQCNQVLSEVNSALGHLHDLQRQYVNVSTKTNTLHEECEHLLDEQAWHVNSAEALNNKLSYFNELDRISSKLGSPTLTVTNESFVPMLSRLDECIAYLNANIQYKESSMYLARFKHCLSKALNFIKSHVVSLLLKATRQAKEVAGQSDDAFTLFYGKFAVNAPRVKSLMEQIEQRVSNSPEYSQILADCHQCYFQQRETLLGSSVASGVNDLAVKHVRDHCTLMRSGCAFMMHVCEDEYKLFFNFFSKSTPLLDSMLETMCNQLYDILRPLIIHVNHLETLAELCTILKVEMIEEHILHNDVELAAFDIVCRQMLADVQERLVYRTHIYINSDILKYNPAPGDIAYPEKLEMMESIAESIKQSTRSRPGSTSSDVSSSSVEVAQINSAVNERSAVNDSSAVNGIDIQPNDKSLTTPLKINVTNKAPSSYMPMSPADLHGMWYPTVRRTLVCLSKLYRCIDRTTFQGLSQETLSLCIQSLTTASDAITKRKTFLDGQLFLIKHLLILREQIAPFQVDFAVRETGLDFSKIKDAAYGLYQHKSRLLSFNSGNALLQFLLEGTPQVTEHFVDSKKDVDNHLKRTCESYIHHVTEITVGPLQSFISKVDVILKMNTEGSGREVLLRQQPFASPDKVHNVVTEVYRNVKTKVPAVLRSMTIYLSNKDTEYILFKPIRSNIQQSFQQLSKICDEHFSEEDQHIIGCPSADQISLLLTK